ncbi:MAG: TetR/AcrR family transcriptional regulator [Pontiella sp.]
MKYDRQDVIEKATHLFWEKGFHATSMRNLQDVLDMRPGSIYAGFGSKEGLFIACLQDYSQKNMAGVYAMAKAAPSPLEAVKTILRSNKGSASAPSGVCMIVKTIIELTEKHAEILDEAKRLMNVFFDALTDLLKQAKDQGELKASKDPKRIARFLQVYLMGMGSYAQANGGCSTSEELIEDALACLD